MTKKTRKKLMERVQVILKKHGQNAFETAKNVILKEKNVCTQVYEALRYFMEESWYDVQHPALISLACKAVGGNSNKAINIGASIVLLAGAADLHDDVIDKSKVKNSRPTVLGKFGKDIAILAGDALLFMGLFLLYKSCEGLSKEQSEAIMKIVKQAFFEISNAEAIEAKHRKDKYNLTPEKYYKIIEAKAAVAEACARIGAILGGGSLEEIDVLGHYGRTLAILMTIRDEFIDIFEPDELANRIKNECLPFPFLYALKNAKERDKLIQLIKANKITEKVSQKLVDLITGMEETQKLKNELRSLIENEINLLKSIKRNHNTLKLILESTLEDL